MKNKFNARAARWFAGVLSTVTASLLATTTAQAHLTYGGAARDFGSYSGLSFGSFSINNQTVRGNYGWADAADGILGDSHSGRAFRFHLDNTAFVGLNVSANATATGTSLGGLNPAFSIYSGLAALAPFSGSQTNSDHDGSLASLAWRTLWVQQNLNPLATDEAPTDGNWNALGNWSIGGDGDLPGDASQLSSFIYQGSAAATAGANTVFGSFLLGPGDYTILIGGNDIANKTSGTALSGYGIAATFSVTPVPEPSAFALVGLGAVILGRVARRRTK
jgi:hypothetical protein